MKKGWFVKDVPFKTIPFHFPSVLEVSFYVSYHQSEFPTSFLQPWLQVEPE
jgi:hypothetical protein